MYSDIGLLTCDREIASDVAAFFNLLTGCSEAVGWAKLAVAPIGLRQKFLDLIDREIQASTPDRPGLIMAKTNSLQDPEICRALYRASQAGVKVLLNVRGICCLRPGISGVSENIEVRSIVDRFLEHARVFYFRNGGHEEVYLSSADWMRRNLSKRLELLFPVIDPNHRRRLIEALEGLLCRQRQGVAAVAATARTSGLPARVRACVPSRSSTGTPWRRARGGPRHAAVSPPDPAATAT